MPIRQQWAFAGFGAWAIAGLFLDGWSHNVAKPETFLTPWHGLLYSGFLAGMGFGVIELGRARRLGTPPVAIAGEGLTGLGMALFILGGIGDGIWHTVFGIEVGIEALISPTHLLLMTGGILLVSAPLRASLATLDPDPSAAPSGRALLPTIVSATLAAAVAGFFLMYLSAFRADVMWLYQTGRPRGQGEGLLIAGMATIFITTAVFVIPCLILVRSWRLRFGALTAVCTALALGLNGLDGFGRAPVVFAAVAAGAVGDVLVARGRQRWIGALIPAVLWPAWFALVAFTGRMGWSTTLWSGAWALASLWGGLLGILAFGGPSSANPTSDRHAASAVRSP